MSSIKKRLAVFISGRGSNLKSLLDSCEACEVYVFTNKKDAKGLEWARKRGVNTECVDLKSDKDWSDLSKKIMDLKISKVILLGFMKIVPPVFLNEYDGEVVNLHPSLLPDFPGLNSIRKSLKASKSVGVSLHHVNKEMDEGPLIYQSGLNKNEYKDLEFETCRVHYLEQRVVSTFLRLGGF